MLKIDVFAPIPNASVRMIIRVKPGLFRMMRKAYRISLNSISMIPPMNQVLRLVTSYGSPFRRLQLYKWEHRSYFLAVGGNTPFRRRYIAASAYWAAQGAARIRLN